MTKPEERAWERFEKRVSIFSRLHEIRAFFWGWRAALRWRARLDGNKAHRAARKIPRLRELKRIWIELGIAYCATWLYPNSKVAVNVFKETVRHISSGKEKQLYSTAPHKITKPAKKNKGKAQAK